MASTFDTSNLTTTGSSSSSFTITLTPSAIGNLLVCQVRMSTASNTVTSVTDDRGGSWAAATTLVRSGSATGQMWYALSTSTSLTTITVNSSGSNTWTLVAASYVTTLSTLAQNNSGVGNDTNLTILSSGSVTITTTQTAVLVHGVSVNPSGDPFTANGAWTERQPGGAIQRAYIADQLDVVAGTYTGDATQATGQDFSAHIAAFVTGDQHYSPPPVFPGVFNLDARRMI